jgi:hypothetical protein
MFRCRHAAGAGALLLAFAASTLAVNIPVTLGLNPVTIPFVPSLNYNVTNIFATPVQGEVIYRWNAPGNAWWTFTYLTGVGWISDSEPTNPTFNVGEGIYYKALVAQIFVADFQGNLVPEIAAGPEIPPVPPPLLPNRYYFQGSPTGQSTTYEGVFGAVPNNETALFRFIPGRTNINLGPDYRAYHYKDGVWRPEIPVLNPLEPVFMIYPYLSLKYTATGSPPTINFTWPARGKLEEAAFLTGPWATVTTANNSYSVAPTNRSRYYRVKE